MRTRFGSQVVILGKDKDDDRFLYCKRENGTRRWMHVSDLVPQTKEDLEVLADRSSVPDASE